jgi:ParB family chromosome partitioning protein
LLHDPFEALTAVPVDAVPPAQELGGGVEVELRRVPLSAIEPSPRNPRKHFDAEGISELAESIAADGLRQPLELRRSPGDPRRFEIVAGERRFRALSRLVADGRLAGDHPVPAQVVGELDDATMLLRALVENLQRQDLHPLEEADAFVRLRDEHGLSTEQIATKAGKSRRWVQIRIALTELPAEMRTAFADGRIGLAEARRLVTTASEAPAVEPDAAFSHPTSPAPTLTPGPSPAGGRGEPERRGGGVPRPLAGEGSRVREAAGERSAVRAFGTRVREALARALADSYPLALRFALAERQAVLGGDPAGELFRQLAELPLAELEVQLAEAVADSLRSSSPDLLDALVGELGLAEVAP